MELQTKKHYNNVNKDLIDEGNIFIIGLELEKKDLQNVIIKMNLESNLNRLK